MKPIRLLMFVKAFYIGGTEVQVLELLRGLPRDRYEIDVAVVDEVGPLLEDVWQLGYLPRAFPLRGSYLSPQSGWQIARLAAFMSERRIELVHAHDFYST